MTNEAKPFPEPRTGWALVLLLTTVYVFSYADRTILGLLVEPIKSDLGLDDAQIGLLMGPAFAILYATMGLPFGWLADRWRRTWLVGLGVAFWSLATAACGLAKSFWQLFLARMSVGVGEATLSPCAMSLVADSFPRERRGRPIAFYSMAIVLGNSAALLIGASLLAWAKAGGTQSLPLIGEVAPWQLIFMVLGVAGLLPALPFFFWKEPARTDAGRLDPGLDGDGLRAMLRYVGRHWTVYASFVSLVCLMTIVAYAGGWNPALFARTWGWAPEKYALWNGLVTLPIGLATYNLAGWASDRLSQRGVADGPLRIMVLGAFILAPLNVLMPLMPTGWSAFAMNAAGGVGIMMLSAVSVTALLNITPAAVRAQVIALYYMVISLAGLFLGPTTVGWLSANVFGEDQLRLAMAVLPALFGVLPLALVPTTFRLYRRHMASLAAVDMHQNDRAQTVT